MKEQFIANAILFVEPDVLTKLCLGDIVALKCNDTFQIKTTALFYSVLERGQQCEKTENDNGTITCNLPDLGSSAYRLV